MAKNRQKKLLTQTGINFAQGRVSTYIIISAHKTTEPLGLVGECVLLAPTIYLKQQDALSTEFTFKFGGLICTCAFFFWPNALTSFYGGKHPTAETRGTKMGSTIFDFVVLCFFCFYRSAFLPFCFEITVSTSADWGKRSAEVGVTRKTVLPPKSVTLFPGTNSDP